MSWSYAVALGAVALGLVGYSASNPETHHFVCEGVKVETSESSSLVNGQARLGLTFHQYNPLVFWLSDEESYTYDYSLASIDREAGRDTVHLHRTKRPIINDSRNWLLTDHTEEIEGGGSIKTVLSLDLISGHASFYEARPDFMVSFKGFCDEKKRVYF